MQQHQGELTARGVAPAVVTFEHATLARNHVRALGLSWPMLLDSDRELYRAYGMERGGWWSVFGPPSWWAYLRLMVRGRRPRRPTDDVHQLGGDVLVDPGGTVRWQYLSRNPADRPSPESILARTT